MNIIILSSSKAQSGGVERFSFYLRNSFEKAGHTVTILGKEDLTVMESNVLKVKKLFGFEQPALGYFLGSKAMKQGFDVCVTNGMLGWNLKKRKIINVQHGTFARAAVRIDRTRNVFKYFVKRYIWGSFEALAVRRATTCVAVSEETAESVKIFYGRNHVSVILNAVDTELFKSNGTPKKKQVIFVGRFEIAKGKEILEGMQAYLESKGWHLLVPQGASQEELSRMYNESELFLLPSLHEGCSYALMDAMACGLPFLASPVGLIPELEQQGLFPECVVHEQTVEAYATAFEKLIAKTNEEKSRLSGELRQYILEKHSLKAFNEAYNNLL